MAFQGSIPRFVRIDKLFRDMVSWVWTGDGTHHKKQRSKPANSDRGMTPIEKNIHVVDEQGNVYEATWPKRARGLVKHGMARFISDDTICLACPPNTILEDYKMNDKVELSWLLQQIAAIQSDTEYLKEGLDQLAQMGIGDSGEPGSPGNILGQARATALRDMIRGRESTNQQLLRLYEKMYDDLLSRPAALLPRPTNEA